MIYMQMLQHQASKEIKSYLKDLYNLDLFYHHLSHGTNS
jgi:hypothetical protein